MPEAASIQVVNIPGGATVIGANEFELMREPNGLSVLVTAGNTSYAWMLGQQGVRYSPRNWTPVLGLPGGGVVYVSPDTGVKNTKDLVSRSEEHTSELQSPIRTTYSAFFLNKTITRK